MQLRPLLDGALAEGSGAVLVKGLTDTTHAAASAFMNNLGYTRMEHETFMSKRGKVCASGILGCWCVTPILFASWHLLSV